MKPTPKSTKERSADWRARQAAQGLTHCPVYAHPDDHPPIKALAVKLAKKRQEKGNGG